MVKLTTIFGLALIACSSAMPTVLTDADQASTDLVPPCMCSGDITGHFCGERAHDNKLSRKPITGSCNATSLFYCSPWTAKTGGIADAIQSPCWTNKCYPSTKLGGDSCTAPVAISNHVNCTKPATPKPIKAQREALGLFNLGASYDSCTPQVVLTATTANSIKPARSTKAAREELVAGYDLATDPCICNGWLGLWCGQRSLKMKTRYRYLVGNCSLDSLYYCSDRSTRSTSSDPATINDRLADTVQSPCWSNKCYQADPSPYSVGQDSCNPVKAERDGFVSDAVNLSVTPDVASAFTPAVVTDCTCGKLTGHFCGARASTNEGHIKGRCNATSLYYCSPWATKTNGFADQVQSPCWTNQCHQAANPGYDSCTPINSDIIGREEALSEAKPLPALECKCGSQKGYFCGNRTITTTTKDDLKSLSGVCDPDSLYICTEAGGQAEVHESQCPADHCRIQSISTGFDYCSKFTNTAREESGLNIASKPKDGCKCGSTEGWFCGSRIQTIPSVNDTIILSGKCNTNTLYYCNKDLSQKHGKAYVSEDKCWSDETCYIEPANTSDDYCKYSGSEVLAERKQPVSKSTPSPSLVAMHELALVAKSKSKHDCKCGSTEGWFCGSRIFNPVYQNDTTSLSGNCDPEDIYYCSETAAKARGKARHYENICPRGICSIVPGPSDDFCTDTAAILTRIVPVERDEVIPAIVANPLPVCTCGKDSGFFCGDRATAAVKKNEHRALTGNCTIGALYHCDDSILAAPQVAKVWENPCSGSDKCYQSVETGFDSCHH